MKKRLIITLGTIAFLAIISCIIVGTVISTKNKEAKLKQLVIAQQTSNKANFDKMFKVIQQVAEVADQYKEAFKAIYPQLIEGRYSNEKSGTLMKWVTESNPTFNTSLYEKLTDAIEANRAEFFNEQQKLIDYQREHNTMFVTWPASWILNPKDTISITIITSKTTKETFATGEENDVNLFKK